MGNGMRFVCLDCGREFDKPARWTEYRGECHGTPAYETMFGCPFCLGDFEEKEEEREEDEDDECDGD